MIITADRRADRQSGGQTYRRIDKQAGTQARTQQIDQIDRMSSYAPRPELLSAAGIHVL